MGSMTLDEALATPPRPSVSQREKPAIRKSGEPGYYEWDGNNGVINTQPTTENHTHYEEFLKDAFPGIDPSELEVVEPVQVRGWDTNMGEGNVVRMHYYRLTVRRKSPGPSIEELLSIVSKLKAPPVTRPTGDSTFVVAIGDIQLGKIDGDGVEGTVTRTINGLYEAARALKGVRKTKPIGEVVVAYMGDCIEGFVSQGGTNAWRTPLPLTQQIRILRRIMLKSVEIFAPLAESVVFVAVPGNHDQSVRFGGKGVTTYDDSFDTDALLAVADACQLAGKFEHVKFHVPDTDEVTVTIETNGTRLGMMHGHLVRGKIFDWWAKQSFGDQEIGQADILLAGHFHHFIYNTSGKRKFIQVPALESESTWFRHSNGESGDPGILTFVTQDTKVNNIEIV